MAERIIVDTSGFFAFLNESDSHHPEARERLLKARSMTTNYVFDELMTLLGARGKRDVAIAFG